MSKAIDEKALKEAVQAFFKSNPELIRTWVADALVEKEGNKPLFPKFDKEKVMWENAIKWEDIDALQELFKDAPPAEEMIKYLSA